LFVNDPPIAVDDNEVLETGLGVGTFDVLENDSDPNGDPLTLDSVTVLNPAQGTATINLDNTVSFQPASGFSGDAVIEYVISDDQGGSDVGLLTVTVSSNFAPVIVEPVSFVVDENESLAANLQAIDFDGDAVTWAIVGGPDAALFTVDENTGALSFINPPDFENPLDVGGDNDYNVIVEASDPFVNSAPQNILVTVENVFEGENRPPVIDDIFGQDADQDVTLFLSGFSQGPLVTITATDPDPSDTLQFNLLGEDADLFDLNPITGVLSLSQPVPGPTGSFDTDSVYELIVQVTDNVNPDVGTDEVNILLPLFASG